ncbi:MAG TPA: FKBP-type peptidyl-prolyl cis-trans isomerase [Acidimicrobiales bacterium]|nr:FKBP-type peptidyl-prolyl cis-trans isomerase [Acidimicrobiales bacterium]HVB71055.1 FKBP-type peptidyl-prolyl cis-trans isomerase [Acidimicrobiales bacterium]
MTDKPLVEPHVGPAPDNLVIEEIVVGTGDEATKGQTAVVHYVGVAASSGEEFDASWNRGDTFSFPLGAGYVIAGWDQGVVGMRVGGRRRLVIPAHLGYGDAGAGGVIAPGETLIFVVDLVELV